MTKINRAKAPDKDSLRSRRRANRGFKSLAESSRKHRRAIRRQEDGRTISGIIYEPGHKVEPDLKGGKLKCFMHTAAGSFKYH